MSLAEWDCNVTNSITDLLAGTVRLPSKMDKGGGRVIMHHLILMRFSPRSSRNLQYHRTRVVGLHLEASIIRIMSSSILINVIHLFERDFLCDVAALYVYT